jgi:polygalacturonase
MVRPLLPSVIACPPTKQPTGFSAGGTNLLLEDNYIVNGDDCLTVGSGAKNIHFRYEQFINAYIIRRTNVYYSNSYCEGGHGLSIGSLGKGGQVADVENVLWVSRPRS